MVRIFTILKCMSYSIRISRNDISCFRDGLFVIFFSVELINVCHNIMNNGINQYNDYNP